MPKSAKSEVNKLVKERVKNPLRNDAERYKKTADLIMVVLGGNAQVPLDKSYIEESFTNLLIGEADIIDDEVIHIDHAPFDTVFDHMIAQGQIVKFGNRYCRSDTSGAPDAKLPEYAFPRRIFGNDKLRDDLRIWLLHWHKSNPRYDSDGSLWVWQQGPDRDIRMLDATLTALAPFFIELLAPRAGSPVRAARLLAARFEATADEIACDEVERAEAGEDVGYSFSVEWFRAEDVNLYSGFFDEVIGHPRQELA